MFNRKLFQNYKLETDLSDFSRIHCTPWHDPQEHAFESRFSLKLASVTTRNATMYARSGDSNVVCTMNAVLCGHTFRVASPLPT